MSIIVDNFKGITFAEETLTAKNDGYIQNNSNDVLGVLEGVYQEINYVTNALTIDINRGLLKIQGRYIENINSQAILELPVSGKKYGYIIVKINLGLTALNQVSLELKEDALDFPILQQDDFKLKPDDGIYEYPILSYELSDTQIIDIIDLRNIIEDVSLQIDSSNNLTIPIGVYTVQKLNDYVDNYDKTVFNYVGTGFQDDIKIQAIIDNIVSPSNIVLSGNIVLDNTVTINKDNVLLTGGVISSTISDELITVDGVNVGIRDIAFDHLAVSGNNYAIDYLENSSGYIDNVLINTNSSGIVRRVNTKVDITNTQILFDGSTSGNIRGIMSENASRDILDNIYINAKGTAFTIGIEFTNNLNTKLVNNITMDYDAQATTSCIGIRLNNTSKILINNCVLNIENSTNAIIYGIGMLNDSKAQINNCTIFCKSTAGATTLGIWFTSTGLGSVSNCEVICDSSSSNTRGILYDNNSLIAYGSNIISNNHVSLTSAGIGIEAINRFSSGYHGNISPSYSISGSGNNQTGNITA